MGFIRKSLWIFLKDHEFIYTPLSPLPIPILLSAPPHRSQRAHKLTCACAYRLSGHVYSITYQSIATQWISNIGITWELVRNNRFWSLTPELLNQNLNFNKDSRWCVYTLNFEEYCTEYCNFQHTMIQTAYLSKSSPFIGRFFFSPSHWNILLIQWLLKVWSEDFWGP